MNLPRSACLTAILLAAAIATVACGSADDTGASHTATAIPTSTPPGTTPPSGPGVTDTQITLGMTNDLAGTGDTPYNAITQAIQAYFRMESAEDGGVCGRDLKLQAEDDAYSPAQALAKTKQLVEQTGVLAMIGGLGTEAQQGVAAYLNDPNGDGNGADGVPDLFLSSPWSGWSDADRYPWTIGYLPDYQTEGVVLGRYVNAKLPGKKLAIIYPDDTTGNDYLSGLSAGLADPAQLMSKQSFAPGATTLVEQVGRAKADGAEVVLLATTPDDTILAMDEAATLQFTPHWLISSANAPSSLASRLGGGSSPDQLLAGFQRLDGAVTTEFLLSTVEDADAPAIKEHTRIMQTYQGPSVSSLSVYGQSLAEVTVETLSRTCNNLTRAGLLAAAESMSGYHSSLLMPGVNVNLSHADHRSVQALQPVLIHADGSVTPDGDVIAAEDVAAPTAGPTPAPSPTLTPSPVPA